ncbi:MAG: OmcA/MtrC family decaheme c-type cytochrome [Comamonadaceae bacterium]|nr:MAG: OmcA/MtrC family decaheme c-type cytochrome [Comamonadaceae bacterium]
MKQIELSSKTRSSPHWTKLAAASLVALAIAGCGGGSDAPVVTPPVVTPPVVTPPVVVVPPVDAPPAGTAVLTAAAASPATTNTAANPAQAFGLIQTAGANSVTIQSPPVVQFTVIGSDGKFVPGLKLANTTSSAAGLAADANCSQNNVTFAIAKFDGTNWQSLISRQRYATADTAVNRNTANPAVPKYRYAVVEGTTDPKPTAPTTVTKADGSTVANFSFANPATAVTDPATRIVGILEENAAGGYYTYRFATDVSTALTMANAVDVKNVSVGKVANNGNVAAKDGKTLHRIGAQLCYTDPVTKAKVVVNPTVDFTLAANGVATPVKAADGSLALSRKVVAMESCNSCHAPLAAHGTRVDPNYCVICHNSGSIDFNTNNPIDLKNMLHKLHGGKNVLTKDYSINGLSFKLTDPVTKAVSGTAFPQDVKNCATCHETKYATQAGNWKTVPSVSACGACHDGINFATGQGLTLGDAAKGATTSLYGHIGGRQADDSKCVLCHTAADTPVYHAAAVKTEHNATLIAGAAEIAYEIGSTTLNANRQAVVTFKVTKNGTPVTAFAVPTLVVHSNGSTVVSPAYEPIAGFAGGPSIYAAYAVPQDGITTPADFNFYASASLGSLLAPNSGTTVVKGTNINTGTLTYDATTGYWTATLMNTSPSSTAAALPIAVPANASMLTGAIIGTFVQKNLAAYPYTPAVVATTPTSNASGGLIIKSMLKQKVATGFTGRRAIVDTAKCNSCHEQLGTDPEFHGGARNDATSCAICHTPNRASSGWAADSRSFIHAIHGAKALTSSTRSRTVPYMWHAVSATASYAKIVFPGDLKKCSACHLDGTYDFTASAYTPALLANLLDVTVATGKFNGASTTAYTISPYVIKDNVMDYGTGFSTSPAAVITSDAAGTNLVSSPIAAACFSCHDSATAQTHMANDGGGSIYATRAVALTKTERCLDCHAAGKASPIKTKHKQ